MRSFFKWSFSAVHVSRTCATEKLKDGCDSRTVVRPGVFGHHNETWCGCNTDLCNIQSPPLPTADDAGKITDNKWRKKNQIPVCEFYQTFYFCLQGPTIKCYACGGQNSSAACEAMPFDPTAEGVTTVDCTTSCDVGKTFSDDGKGNWYFQIVNFWKRSVAVWLVKERFIKVIFFVFWWFCCKILLKKIINAIIRFYPSSHDAGLLTLERWRWMPGTYASAFSWSAES